MSQIIELGSSISDQYAVTNHTLHGDITYLTCSFYDRRRSLTRNTAVPRIQNTMCLQRVIENVLACATLISVVLKTITTLVYIYLKANKLNHEEVRC